MLVGRTGGLGRALGREAVGDGPVAASGAAPAAFVSVNRRALTLLAGHAPAGRRGASRDKPRGTAPRSPRCRASAPWGLARLPCGARPSASARSWPRGWRPWFGCAFAAVFVVSSTAGCLSSCVRAGIPNLGGAARRWFLASYAYRRVATTGGRAFLVGLFLPLQRLLVPYIPLTHYFLRLYFLCEGSPRAGRRARGSRRVAERIARGRPWRASSARGD